MGRLRQPKVTEKLVPVFSSGELSRLENTCQGRAFVQRRHQAIMSVFRATGIRLSELAGIRCQHRDSEWMPGGHVPCDRGSYRGLLPGVDGG
jgi:integrase/recombinase XerD